MLKKKNNCQMSCINDPKQEHKEYFYVCFIYTNFVTEFKIDVKHQNVINKVLTIPQEKMIQTFICIPNDIYFCINIQINNISR